MWLVNCSCCGLQASCGLVGSNEKPITNILLCDYHYHHYDSIAGRGKIIWRLHTSSHSGTCAQVQKYLQQCVHYQLKHLHWSSKNGSQYGSFWCKPPRFRIIIPLTRGARIAILECTCNVPFSLLRLSWWSVIPACLTLLRGTHQQHCNHERIWSTPTRQYN